MNASEILTGVFSNLSDANQYIHMKRIELVEAREENEKLRKQVTDYVNINNEQARDIEKLKRRPILIVLDDVSQNRRERILCGTHNVDRLLVPGKKIKLEIKFDKGTWRCETPMMIVESPQVIVDTVDYHTSISDDILATQIRPK